MMKSKSTKTFYSWLSNVFSPSTGCGSKDSESDKHRKACNICQVEKRNNQLSLKKTRLSSTRANWETTLLLLGQRGEASGGNRYLPGCERLCWGCHQHKVQVGKIAKWYIWLWATLFLVYFFNTVSNLNISHETFPAGETRKQLSKKNWWKLPQKR